MLRKEREDDPPLSPSDLEDGQPLDSKRLLEQLRRPPIFVVPAPPRLLALALGVSPSEGVPIRSPGVPVLMILGRWEFLKGRWEFQKAVGNF